MHLFLLAIVTSLTSLLPFKFSYDLLYLFDSLRNQSLSEVREEFDRLVTLRFYHMLLSLLYLAAVVQFLFFSPEEFLLVRWNQVGLSLLVVFYPMFYMNSLLREKFSLAEKEFPKLRTQGVEESIREAEREFFQGESPEPLDVFRQVGGGFPLSLLRQHLSQIESFRGEALEEGNRIFYSLEWVRDKAQVIRNYHNLFDIPPCNPKLWEQEEEEEEEEVVDQ